VGFPVQPSTDEHDYAATQVPVWSSGTATLADSGQNRKGFFSVSTAQRHKLMSSSAYAKGNWSSSKAPRGALRNKEARPTPDGSRVVPWRGRGEKLGCRPRLTATGLFLCDRARNSATFQHRAHRTRPGHAYYGGVFSNDGRGPFRGQLRADSTPPPAYAEKIKGNGKHPSPTLVGVALDRGRTGLTGGRRGKLIARGCATGKPLGNFQSRGVRLIRRR